MSQEAEWLRRQGEYNRRVYGRPEADHDDLAGWKATVLFYSALHRVNYWFDARTGQVPKNHYERNRRVEDKPPAVFGGYRYLPDEHAGEVPRGV